MEHKASMLWSPVTSPFNTHQVGTSLEQATPRVISKTSQVSKARAKANLDSSLPTGLGGQKLQEEGEARACDLPK